MAEEIKTVSPQSPPDEQKEVSAGGSDADILREAKDRLTDCFERENDERAKQLEDVKFATLDQWPQEIRNQRQNDPNGPRPCLTVDKLQQYRMQIINEIRKNRPAVKVRPVDSVADPETAEVLQGITRHIEDQSRAGIAYQTAAEWAIDSGVGYFRLTTDYVSPESFDQEIYIKPVFDPFSIYLGPHLMPDGSDAEYGFVIEDFPVSVFNRKWPKAKGSSAEIEGVGNSSPFWVGKNTVRVAEYFRYVYEKKTLLRLSDGNSVLEDEYDELPPTIDGLTGAILPKPEIVDKRDTSVRSVQWLVLSESEILDRREWAGKFIPIIKVVGHQKLVDGKKSTWGIIRPAIDSARMYNYWVSTITEKLALSPKMPYVGAVGQFSGQEFKWQTANTINHAYLEYNPIDVNGNAVPAPRRVEPAALETAMIQQLQLIEHDIQTSLGMFKASVGNTEGNQSGRAIRALQNQSDTATFHFPDNLSLSISYLGRILIDLAPKIYDTERVIRMIGDDGKAQYAQLNPNQGQAVRKVKDQTGAVKSIYNIGIGLYDVTATVGPSYATKRMETVDILQDAMKGNPNLVPMVGDLMFRALDAPMADQIADRLQKMLPPQLQGDGNEQPIPPQVKAQMDQLTQAAHAMSQEIEQLRSEVTDKRTEFQLKNKELDIKAAEVHAKTQVQASATETTASTRLAEIQARRDEAMLKYATQKGIALHEIAAELQIASMNAHARATSGAGQRPDGNV